MGLTRKESSILEWIKKSDKKKITIKMIEDQFKISYRVAREYLIALESKEKLESDWEEKGHKKYWTLKKDEDWY